MALLFFEYHQNQIANQKNRWTDRTLRTATAAIRQSVSSALPFLKLQRIDVLSHFFVHQLNSKNFKFDPVATMARVQELTLLLLTAVMMLSQIQAAPCLKGSIMASVFGSFSLQSTDEEHDNNATTVSTTTDGDYHHNLVERQVNLLTEDSQDNNQTEFITENNDTTGLRIRKRQVESDLTIVLDTNSTFLESNETGIIPLRKRHAESDFQDSNSTNATIFSSHQIDKRQAKGIHHFTTVSSTEPSTTISTTITTSTAARITTEASWFTKEKKLLSQIGSKISKVATYTYGVLLTPLSYVAKNITNQTSTV